MNIRRGRIGLAATVTYLLLPGLSAAQDGEWLVAPYIWAADVGWDLSARGSGSVEFGDIVEKLDGAGLIRLEYMRNKIGFTFDYVGMSLKDNTNISTPGPLPVSTDINASVDLTVFEAGIFYRPSATEGGIDILAGVRDNNVDSALVLTPKNAAPERFDTGKSFTDVYVGARYLHRFNESWDLSLRGDYGFGGSDGAINIIAEIGWRSSGSFGMSLAYRHYAFDFDHSVNGESTTSEFDFSGPALSFLFRF